MVFHMTADQIRSDDDQSGALHWLGTHDTGPTWQMARNVVVHCCNYGPKIRVVVSTAGAGLGA